MTMSSVENPKKPLQKPKGASREYLSGDNRKARLEEMRRLAQEYGGECLSDQYVHCNEKLVFSCPVHGKFEAKPSKIAAGHWCRRCPIEARQAIVIARLTKYIAEKGGKLLSVYSTAKEKITVECDKGHVFTPTPDNMLSKFTWCPRCSKGKPRPWRRKLGLSVPLVT